MDHLLGRIVRRARDDPDRVAVRFIENTSGKSSVLTWLELERAAWAARAQFAARGLVPGDRILLLLPTGPAYVASLLGSLWAGLVPATLPRPGGSQSKVDREVADLIDVFAPHAVVGVECTAVGTEVIPAEGLGCPGPPVSGPRDFSALQDLCYVQFSSGSTARPRGLALTWAAIEANLDAIVAATGMGIRHQAVSWLPMYHDMGLFGSLLACLYAGCEHTIMDPAVFVANPLMWLRIMHERRATITVAPPSALKSCLELLRRRPSTELDLSSLEQVICGSEPIPPSLTQAFGTGFGRYGAGVAALRPVYGLAEATLAVAFSPLGRAPRADRIARAPFEKSGHAMPVSLASREPAVAWVSAGKPLPGIELKVVGDDGQPVPERRAGRIWVRSPSLYSAILEEGLFRKRSGQWLDTGDTGYMAEGELYVTGRVKDLIIKNGRNYSPERLEELAGLVNGVRRCAAIGVFDENRATERIVLMIEVQPRHLACVESRDRMRLSVRGELRAAGYPVDEVHLLAKGTLPLTTSGKVRRHQSRELYSSLHAPAA